MSESQLRAELAALRAENARLSEQNWKLTLALLERPVPADCPPEGFPAKPAPHIDPPPHHPDGDAGREIWARLDRDFASIFGNESRVAPHHPDHDEHHVIVAAFALDPMLAAHRQQEI